MNFEDIVKKYNYSEELAKFLKQIYDELVIEFGSEKEAIVYETFLNIEVVDCGDIYAYLKENYIFKGEELMISSCALKTASGMSYSNSKISYDESSNTYVLDEVERTILVCNLSKDEDYVKGSLIHELAHAVKEYYKGYEIKGDLLIVRSGFIERVYKLSYEGGHVKETLIQEIGVGLEEGLNSALEHSIAKRIVNPNYCVSGYEVVRSLASILLEQLNLKTMILDAQIMKEKDNFANEFDLMFMDGAFARFESILDKIHELALQLVSDISNSKLIEESRNKIDDLINNDLNNLLIEMKEARNAKRNVA